MRPYTLITRALTFLGGLYFVLYFLLPEAVLIPLGVKEAHENISYGFVLVGAVAFGVGIINLVLIHGINVLKLRGEWGYSIALLLGLFSMGTLSILDWIGDLQVASLKQSFETAASFSKHIKEDLVKGDTSKPPLTVRQRILKDSTLDLLNAVEAKLTHICFADEKGCNDANALLGVFKGDISSLAESTDHERGDEFSERIQKLEAAVVPVFKTAKEKGTSTKLFTLLNEGFFVALGSSMFALLAFYITSAAYRAFRIKNLESALLLAAAMLVMLGQIPLGAQLSEKLPHIRLWLLKWPNSAAFRAISIGASVAGLVMSIRLWLSLGIEGSDE